MIRILNITNGMWIPRYENGVQVAMNKVVSVVFKLSPATDFAAMAKNYLVKANQKFFIDKQPEKALKYLNKGINLLPNNESLLVVRGMCRFELGDETGAREDWNRITDTGKMDLKEYTAQLAEMKGYDEMMAMLKK